MAGRYDFIDKVSCLFEDGDALINTSARSCNHSDFSGEFRISPWNGCELVFEIVHGAVIT